MLINLSIETIDTILQALNIAEEETEKAYINLRNKDKSNKCTYGRRAIEKTLTKYEDAKAIFEELKQEA